jgi:mannose/fructose/N-acetylgalactosamine-specific phosphotransferase system component IIC
MGAALSSRARGSREAGVNLTLLATILLGGVVALDATPLAQTLLSQPLVTGTLLGWWWGDMPTALSTAIVLQIFAASTQPVGARTPEDYAVGGVVGTGLALALSAPQSFEFARQSSILFGVIGGMLTAVLAARATRWQRRRNEALSRWCEERLRAGADHALGQAHVAALVLAFGVGLLLTAVAMGVGLTAFSGLVQSDSLRLSRAWRLAQPLLIGVGLAQLLHLFVERRLLRAALFGAALIGTWLVLMLGGS